MRPYLGTQILEHLQAVNMIGMIMAHDYPLDGLVGDFFNRIHEFFPQHRRAQRIEYHHAFIRHHKTGIGHKTFIGRRSQPSLAPDIIRMRANLDRFHGQCSRTTTLRKGEKAEAKQ